MQDENLVTPKLYNAKMESGLITKMMSEDSEISSIRILSTIVTVNACILAWVLPILAILKGMPQALYPISVLILSMIGGAMGPKAWQKKFEAQAQAVAQTSVS